jgi:hypothetical protein
MLQSVCFVCPTVRKLHHFPFYETNDGSLDAYTDEQAYEKLSGASVIEKYLNKTKLSESAINRSEKQSIEALKYATNFLLERFKTSHEAVDILPKTLIDENVTIILNTEDLEFALKTEAEIKELTMIYYNEVRDVVIDEAKKKGEIFRDFSRDKKDAAMEDARKKAEATVCQKNLNQWFNQELENSSSEVMNELANENQGPATDSE